MSFSGEVREELFEIIPGARHCRLAELAAICFMNGHVEYDGSYSVTDENILVPKKASELMKKLFGRKDEYTVEEAGSMLNGKPVYVVRLGKEEAVNVLLALKIGYDGEDKGKVSPLVYSQTCCKRSFLRGVFLAAGALSDPEKDYHFEIGCDTSQKASIISEIMAFFNIEAKIIARKKYHVVYIKDSEAIVDLLNIMEAHVSLMKLENIRIVKGLRNSVNRRVNCETANIDKTVTAAAKQVSDIEYIRDTVGFDRLSDDLKATAVIRLEHSSSPLSELGKYHDHPIGRSGVNHRLARLSEIAERIRNGKPID